MKNSFIVAKVVSYVNLGLELRIKELGLRKNRNKMLRPAANTVTTGYKGLIAYQKAIKNTSLLFVHYKKQIVKILTTLRKNLDLPKSYSLSSKS